jgi:hypothetical protein
MAEEKKRKRKIKEPTVTQVPEVEEPIIDEEQEEGGFEVKRPPWLMRIEGLDLDIPLTGLKLPMFTTGMIDRGDFTIETINVPEIALNSYFRSWLMKPAPRRVELRMLDGIGKDVERWTMLAVPGAMGFSELDVQDDAPWVTQVAYSATEIKIEPTSG